MSPLQQSSEVKASRPRTPVAGLEDDEEELLTYAALAEAVVGGLGKMDVKQHKSDVDYVVRQALTAGVTTQAGAREWVSRQLVHTRRSGFLPPNAKYFPEPAVVQLVKYLRFAEKARSQP